ncbi:MAG: hypothetical protein ACT4PV_06025 [Planctomycetaceae bacterium]
MTPLHPLCVALLALSILLAPPSPEWSTLEGEDPPAIAAEPGGAGSGAEEPGVEEPDPDAPPTDGPGTDEPPTDDPVPTLPTPPAQVQQDTECDWSQVLRLPVDLTNNSMSCGGPTGNCFAVSMALAKGAAVTSYAYAYDATLFGSASTASSASSLGILHIWRSDTAPCASSFFARARLAFRAKARVEPNAAAGAGATQEISSGGGELKATTDGSIELSSASGAVVGSVKVGGVTVTLAASGGQERSRDFIGVDEGEWPSKIETFLLLGTAYAFASANGTLADPSGEGSASLERTQADLFVFASCESPCSAFSVYTAE